MIAVAQLPYFFSSRIENRSYFSKFIVFQNGIKHPVLCPLTVCRKNSQKI